MTIAIQQRKKEDCSPRPYINIGHPFPKPSCLAQPDRLGRVFGPSFGLALVATANHGLPVSCVRSDLAGASSVGRRQIIKVPVSQDAWELALLRHTAALFLGSTFGMNSYNSQLTVASESGSCSTWISKPRVVVFGGRFLRLDLRDLRGHFSSHTAGERVTSSSRPATNIIDAGQLGLDP